MKAQRSVGVAKQEMKMLALARANIYRLLAALYADKPSTSLVQCLKSGELIAALAEFSDSQESARQTELAVAELDDGALLDRLAVEHTRLFIGPGPGYVAPFQSVYTDKWTIDYCGLPDTGIAPRTGAVDGLMWGDSTVEASRKYLSVGLKLADNQLGAPDHIGLELSFMHHLCVGEGEAWATGSPSDARTWLSRQKAFLDEHLLRWVDRFAGLVQQQAEHPFYSLMAGVTSKFVRSDAAEVAVILAEAASPVGVSRCSA